MGAVAVRVREHRERMRSAGLKSVQIWVPDTQRVGFAQECRMHSQIITMSDNNDPQLRALMDEALTTVEGWN
jgi:Protein  of unknown function (DUF3018)